jgi:hypothetical protein
MSREIKFRVWMDGGWVYCSNPSFQPGQCGDFGLHFESDREVHYSEEVKVIQQFTGLLDKNGVEIYEGDIIEHNKYTYLVVFETGAFCVRGLEDKEKWKSIIFASLFSYFLGLGGLPSVIGNIFQNPELLKS